MPHLQPWAVLVLGTDGSSVGEVSASAAGLSAAVVYANMCGAGAGYSIEWAASPSAAGRRPAADTSPYVAMSIEHRAPLPAGGVRVGADVRKTGGLPTAGREPAADTSPPTIDIGIHTM
jgi:hypothetical protein